MGLDMYLSRRVFIGNEYRANKNMELVRLTGSDAGSWGEPHGIKDERISYIPEGVGYWRKANAIHAWFVRNAQDGKDECQESPVTREQLQELLDLCRKVIGNAKNLSGIDKELAEKELSPQGGFFFGSTDMDDGYFEDLKHTISILEPILAVEQDAGEYSYHASW